MWYFFFHITLCIPKPRPSRNKVNKNRHVIKRISHVCQGSGIEDAHHTSQTMGDPIYVKYSCETVALRENFVDRPESYDSFSAKSCIFLAHALGYISPFPYTICLKTRYKKKFLYHLPTLLVPSLPYKVLLPFVTWPNIEISNYIVNDGR
jgi:hypothetical protein